MNQNTANTNRSARAYANVVLTVIAVLLAVLVVDQNDGQLGPISTAAAQSSANRQTGGGLVSAADQRKNMISELSEINTRLERIERALGQGLNVRVMNAPTARDEDAE